MLLLSLSLTKPGGFFCDGLACVKIGDKWGYIDTTGKYIINPQFDEAREFDDGLAQVKIGDKWGYIDTTGKYIINPQFDEIGSFYEGMASVKIGDKWGYIDTTGVIVINPQFDYAYDFYEVPALVRLGDKYGYIDKEGKYAINPQFDDAEWFEQGLASVRIGNRWGYINTEGKYVINPQFEFAESFHGGLAKVEIGNKYGYIDTEGKYVINPQFDFASTFYSQTADAEVKLGDKYGRIDTTGKYIINPQFEDVGWFNCGLANVKIGDKWGYIDTAGEYVIHPQFDDAKSFYGGLAKVEIGNNWGYIDKECNWVWQSRSQDDANKLNKKTKPSSDQAITTNVSSSEVNKERDTQWATYSIPNVCSITVPPTMELRDENSVAGQLFSTISPLFYQLMCDDCNVFSDHTKIVFQPVGMNSNNKADIDKATSTYARIIIEFGYNNALGQNDIITLTQKDLAEYSNIIEAEYRREFALAQQSFNQGEDLVWHPVQKKKVGGKHCLVLDYDRPGLQGMVKVKKYIFYYNGKEIDVTLSYRISEKVKYENDFNKSFNSLKFE